MLPNHNLTWLDSDVLHSSLQVATIIVWSVDSVVLADREVIQVSRVEDDLWVSKAKAEVMEVDLGFMVTMWRPREWPFSLFYTGIGVLFMKILAKFPAKYPADIA